MPPGPHTPRPKKRRPLWRGPFTGIALTLGLLALLQYGGAALVGRAAVPYSAFRTAVDEGRVREVQLSATTVRGAWAPTPDATPQPFVTVRVEDPKLLEDLRAKGVEVTGVAPSSGLGDLWMWLLLPLGVIGVSLWMRSRGELGQGGVLAVGRSKAKLYAEQAVPVRFSDVAGVDEAKEELEEIIDFLRHPEKFHRVGGRIPRGILLVGPPGTGKTLLARAVAGEAQVPFFSISGSEFVEMFVGVGAARVRDLFEQARAKAPCIIFIDELDALGKARGAGPMAHEEREQTLNQLLVELDGFDTRTGVVLMAATNRPEILDPALLRAGRFDRQVLVDRPDRAGRLAILKVHARKVALADEADLEGIAAMTAGMVGADMANVLNEAALLAVRRGRDRISRAELEEAVERVVTGLEKKNRVLSKKEKERVAHHEVGHALVALALPGGEAVRKISVIPRGISALGYTLQAPTEDRYLMTRTELLDKIAVLLGGRAAEELVFGEVSTGARDDLQKATAIARSMVVAYGMSEALGPTSAESDTRPLLLEGANGQPHSEELARTIDREIRQLVEAQAARAEGLLRARAPLLREAAKELLARETLTGERLEELCKAHDEAQALPAA